ncbi:MAG: hypothetical protein WC823_01800 [Parcubacteria group bacterium]|jgi:hypothetical protein
MMIIVAMAIASETTYILATKVAAPEQKTAVTSVTAPTPQPSPTPAVQPIEPTQSTIPADWKAYRSEKYGFEFQYPKTLTFISEEEKKYGNDDTIYFKINTDGGPEWNNKPFPLLTVLIQNNDERKKEIKNNEFYDDLMGKELKDGIAMLIKKNNISYTLAKGFQDGPSYAIQFVGTDDYKKLISTFKFTN